MSYNLLNFPTVSPERIDDLEVINQYILPDVLLVNELVNISGAQSILNQTLNTGGINYYARANYVNGYDTDNLLFYNTSKLALKSQNSLTTDLRDINEYILYYLAEDLATTDDTIFFYFYTTHLKAGSDPENEQQRFDEVTVFRNHLDAIPQAENIFFGGDFNLYTANESAYDVLVDQGVFPLNDPVQPPGNWHENYNFRHYHTQSTRTASFGGGATGGLDDRFDFILYSDDVQSGENKVTYIENSFEAFGNDGNHFNKSLIDTPTNPNVPAYITNALYNMSDHLPVLMNIKVEATIDTTSANLVITEIMYNPPEGGADSLEFIEIMNLGSTDINIGGYKIEDAINFTFPSYNLPSGDFVLIAGNPVAILNTFGKNAFQWSGGLSNGGEEITLTNGSGLEIDKVNYDDISPWPVEADGIGHSIALCDPSIDNNTGSNWMASQHFVAYNEDEVAIYASPGIPECELPPIANFEADNTVILLGENIQFSDLSLNNPSAWLWNFEGGNPSTSTDQNPVVNYSMTGSFNVQLTVSNNAGSDVLLAEDYIIVTENSSPQLIISEIMQNPFSVSDANGEWFEIFNPASTDLNINGYVIKDNDNDSLSISGNLIVPAKGFAVLGINSNSSTNGGYICDYQYSEFFLSNTADEIVICLPDGITELDRIEYHENEGWPDPSGSSMVFTGTSEIENNNPTIWGIASQREQTYNGATGDKGSPGTNGIDQNLLSSDFILNLKVFLEGPFNGTDMNNYLTNPLLVDGFPLSQPYAASPWNYSGNESVTTLPSENIVDWVLVELRDASNAALADASTIKQRAALFLLSNGLVVDLDGNSLPSFSIEISEELFVSIIHRNHIGIISANALNLQSDTYTYDFTNGESKVYQGLLGHKYLNDGIWGMVSGDMDASGLINESDLNPLWKQKAGLHGYYNEDLNLNTEIDNTDKNLFWQPNYLFECRIPE